MSLFKKKKKEPAIRELTPEERDMLKRLRKSIQRPYYKVNLPGTDEIRPPMLLAFKKHKRNETV